MSILVPHYTDDNSIQLLFDDNITIKKELDRLGYIQEYYEKEVMKLVHLQEDYYSTELKKTVKQQEEQQIKIQELETKIQQLQDRLNEQETKNNKTKVICKLFDSLVMTYIVIIGMVLFIVLYC